MNKQAMLGAMAVRRGITAVENFLEGAHVPGALVQAPRLQAVQAKVPVPMNAARQAHDQLQA